MLDTAIDRKSCHSEYAPGEWNVPIDTDFPVRCLNKLGSATEKQTEAGRLDAAIEENLKSLGFLDVQECAQ